jgi:hypothetical protein
LSVPSGRQVRLQQQVVCAQIGGGQLAKSLPPPLTASDG